VALTRPLLCNANLMHSILCS